MMNARRIALPVMLIAGLIAPLAEATAEGRGHAVTMTATVLPTPPGAGTPTGTVSFFDGDASVADCASVSLVVGFAKCVSRALPPGEHGIIVKYIGDHNFLGSVSPVRRKIVDLSKIETTVGLATQRGGNGLTVRASVTPEQRGSGFPTGTIEFKSRGVIVCSSTLTDGAAECSSSQVLAARDTLHAFYLGDDRFDPSVSDAVTEGEDRVGTAIELTASSKTSDSGQIVTFTAAVNPLAQSSSIASGVVTFLDRGRAIAGCEAVALTSGSAQCGVALDAGSHAVSVIYGGDDTFETSVSPTVMQVVRKPAKQ